MSIKLDYTLNTPEERRDYVEKITQENPDLTNQYLEYLADYLVFCMEKEERKKKKILTENRMVTVNKRETSYEGLATHFECGEDGFYDLIKQDKNIIFRHKITITKEDLQNIPELAQVKEAIELWEQKLKNASGRDAYIIKKAIIDLRKDQYFIKNEFLQPVQKPPSYFSANFTPISSEEWVDSEGQVHWKGVSFLDPQTCSAILCDYSRLKESAYGDFIGDLYYFMEAFDAISSKALEPYPLYRRLVEHKIDGRQNIQIQQLLQEEFGIKHSTEYISSLWRNKIPNLIADKAEDEFLDYWYLNVEKGKYKKCSRCGQIKLAHNKYFSKNKTSKDGYYSICKECRNKKGVS